MLKVKLGITKSFVLQRGQYRNWQPNIYVQSAERCGSQLLYIQCRKCMKWIHKKCSGIKWRLAKIKIFDCNMCETNQADVDYLKNLNMNGDVIEKNGDAMLF